MFTVIRCLHARYKKNSFYTWAGPTLVALNPQREMPEVYSRNVMQLFAHETFTYTNPHIFALGQRSLRHLQWGIGKTHQAIVVNGESGAGKVHINLSQMQMQSFTFTSVFIPACCRHVQPCICSPIWRLWSPTTMKL